MIRYILATMLIASPLSALAGDTGEARWCLDPRSRAPLHVLCEPGQLYFKLCGRLSQFRLSVVSRREDGSVLARYVDMPRRAHRVVRAEEESAPWGTDCRRWAPPASPAAGFRCADRGLAERLLRRFCGVIRCEDEIAAMRVGCIGS